MLVGSTDMRVGKEENLAGILQSKKASMNVKQPETNREKSQAVLLTPQVKPQGHMKTASKSKEMKISRSQPIREHWRK